MIKGAQKKMIVVKTGDSRLFEEAYFVLRRDADERNGDMVAEADRIISLCGGKRGKRRRVSSSEWLFAAVGFLCGGMNVGIIAWILAIFD